MSSCKFCNKDANLMCQRCFESYCGVDCQIRDWRSHKATCVQMPILVPMNSILKTNFSEITIKKEQSEIKRNPEPEQHGNVEKKIGAIQCVKSNTAKKEIVVSDSKRINGTFNITDHSLFAWKKPFSYPVGEFFNAIVQYVDENNHSLLWVTQKSHVKQSIKLLHEINNSIKSSTQSCKIEDIKKGAMLAVPLDNIYYRGLVLESVEKSQIAIIQLIDHGNILTVPFQHIKPPIPIMKNLNAYAFCVFIEHRKSFQIEEEIKIRTIGSEIFENGVSVVPVELDEKTSFTAQSSFEEENQETLKNDYGEERSLIEQLRPLEINDEQNVGIKADNKFCSNTVHTIDSLELIPIPNGDSVDIIVLDSSTISKGYFTGCDLGNKKFLKKQMDFLKLVAKYCDCPDLPSYAPRKNELCLAVFPDDELWYRAVCLEVISNDKFAVMFVDYGNISFVNKENIRQITKKLLFPTNACMCFVEEPFDQEKFAKIIATNPIISCKVTAATNKKSFLVNIHKMKT